MWLRHPFWCDITFLLALFQQTALVNMKKNLHAAEQCGKRRHFLIGRFWMHSKLQRRGGTRCATLTINVPLFTLALPLPFSFSILIRLISKGSFFFLQNTFFLCVCAATSPIPLQPVPRLRRRIKPPLVCHLQWLTCCLDAVNQILFLGAILESNSRRIIKGNLDMCASPQPSRWTANVSVPFYAGVFQFETQQDKRSQTTVQDTLEKQHSCFHNSPCCFWSMRGDRSSTPRTGFQMSWS